MGSLAEVMAAGAEYSWPVCRPVDRKDLQPVSSFDLSQNEIVRLELWETLVKVICMLKTWNATSLSAVQAEKVDLLLAASDDLVSFLTHLRSKILRESIKITIGRLKSIKSKSNTLHQQFVNCSKEGVANLFNIINSNSCVDAEVLSNPKESYELYIELQKKLLELTNLLTFI